MWNEFCIKHPIIATLFAYLFFIVMVYLVWITDGMGPLWFYGLETVLVLGCITHIIYLLDPNNVKKVKDGMKMRAKDEAEAKKQERKERAKRKKEWKEASVPVKIRKVWLKILEYIICIAIGLGIVWYMVSNEPKVACDDNSMRVAEKLLNDGFPNFNGNLRLSNPQVVRTGTDSVRCVADTNIHEKVHYDVEKQADGRILISTNPIGDIIQEAIDDMSWYY